MHSFCKVSNLSKHPNRTINLKVFSTQSIPPPSLIYNQLTSVVIPYIYTLYNVYKWCEQYRHF